MNALLNFQIPTCTRRSFDVPVQQGKDGGIARCSSRAYARSSHQTGRRTQTAAQVPWADKGKAVLNKTCFFLSIYSDVPLNTKEKPLKTLQLKISVFAKEFPSKIWALSNTELFSTNPHYPFFSVRVCGRTAQRNPRIFEIFLRHFLLRGPDI